MPQIVDHPSPNFEARSAGAAPSLVILHYTGMMNGAVALKRLCDPASKVSSHYLVEEDGKILRLVDESQRAWHAGESFWRGITDINSHSIGIELVNPGHEFGYREFPKAQIQALLELCRDIKLRHKLADDAFLGHSDIAPMRKQDPGELFDWKFMAKNGIGVWPLPQGQEPTGMEAEEAQALLRRYGYAEPKGRRDLKILLRAFQRHFDPQNLSGELTGATPGHLRALVRISDVS